MLFDRPLASFTNNIIYIDRPKKSKDMPVDISQLIYSASNLDVPKEIAEIVRQNLLSSLRELPTTYHTTILRLCRFHLSYSGKNDEKSCLKYSIHCCFPKYFPASFLSRLPTQAHASGFSHRTKIYGTCAARCPSARFLSNELIWSLKEFALGTKTWGY